MLMPTRRLFQCSGGRGAVASRPESRYLERLPSKGRECLKLQSVSGHSGSIKRAFMSRPPGVAHTRVEVSTNREIRLEVVRRSD